MTAWCRSTAKLMSYEGSAVCGEGCGLHSSFSPGGRVGHNAPAERWGCITTGAEHGRIGAPPGGADRA